jgi:hypothetical protein
MLFEFARIYYFTELRIFYELTNYEGFIVRRPAPLNTAFQKCYHYFAIFNGVNIFFVIRWGNCLQTHVR